jgi:hypothetical protein
MGGPGSGRKKGVSGNSKIINNKKILREKMIANYKAKLKKKSSVDK